jgi:hypothetical protein
MGWTCGTYVEEWKYIGVFVKKPKGNRPFGRNRHRWQNMKFDF